MNFLPFKSTNERLIVLSINAKLSTLLIVTKHCFVLTSFCNSSTEISKSLLI
jgi:hypothetical protein